MMADKTDGEDVVFEDQSAARLALKDLVESLRNTRFWLTLAWVDILQRYRGSMLGPTWLTLSTGALLFGLGPLYAVLFGADIAEYMPYLAAGLIVWNFLVATVNESCQIFISSGSVMKQIRVPRLVFVLQLVARNAIIFLHGIPLFFLVHIWFGKPWHWGMLWAIPGFVLLCILLANAALILAVISVRFRDFIQIVQSIMQIAFFVTPIIWHASDRPMLRLASDLNPLAAAIALIRSPLLDEPFTLAHQAWTFGGVIVMSAASFYIFARYRRRIIYWV